MATDEAPAPEQFDELEVSLADLQLVGRGRTADVYAWDGGQVLKLFQEWMPEDAVRREALGARLARVGGLPTPAVSGLLLLASRRGIVYERVPGDTMLRTMQQNMLKVWSLASLLGALHAATHLASGRGLMPLTRHVGWNIEHAEGITARRRQELLDQLRALPTGEALCHGDFHPDNVVMTGAGPVIIDWMTAVCGNPVADVARSLLMIRSGAPLEKMSAIQLGAINVARGVMYRHYLRAYRQARPAPDDELAAWRPIMAAARLTEGVPESEKVWLRRVAAGED